METAVEKVESSPPYSLQWTTETPASISCLSVGPSGHIFAGSDDGSVRVYNRDSPKVQKAIRGLGSEVSSIICLKEGSNTDLGLLWVASGRRAFSFSMNSSKMILMSSDATSTIELGADDEDVLNELTLNHKRTEIAFSLDSGVVGTFDLSTKKVTRMRSKHNTICGTVRFIPDRPNELVSGGFDSALLHFDYHQATLLSRFDLTAPPPSSGVSLSPPFILSSSVSQSGIISAGTADGRIWVGIGGEKSPSGQQGAQKKRRRKWEGLQHEDGLAIKIAEGPIVAVSFTGPRTLLSCTLLGTVVEHELEGNTGNNLALAPVWTNETQCVTKVNALVAVDDQIIIGGLSKDGKGAVEIWIKS
ncbi:hypothetical protein SERLA73DRAFT_186531 [Serpula lacrymans var. lacrymans S7.3]|uniref:Anaphase-promoting complex subunit 4 WD40 domain-containing protein n=2 Tax=Serpula lacrymans var. lacrymans TaxID=341189 RepID=F8Q7F8_SERL3|nr:uncharacterized protein SERLADRAFT_475641 [Serpula lacrymans var. lacrymans S7.9]EGN95496.1 hypothetical protein SERLA73DRAFT_186531 [Serpula lacrymans var. lacrymans S7.3]EGO21024.1 hypothetical protein SERLADRAFT_475641 [Serpula lacrymans var. lacrymans S7.9]